MRDVFRRIFGGGDGNGTSGGAQAANSPVHVVDPHACSFPNLPPIPHNRKSNRHYPPGHAGETKIGGISVYSITTPRFVDKDILAVNLRPEEFQSHFSDPQGGAPVRVGQLPNNRHVILQIGWLGGAQACAEMIKKDRGIEPNVPLLKTAHFTDIGDLRIDLMRAGLQVDIRQFDTSRFSLPDNLRPLEAFNILNRTVKDHGPIILSLEHGTRSHALIMDGLNGHAVSVRDPFHGWSIEVSEQAFTAQLGTRVKYLTIAPNSGKSS